MHDDAVVSEAGSPAVQESSGFNVGLVVALLVCLVFWEAVVLGVVTGLDRPRFARWPPSEGDGHRAFAWPE